MSATGIPVSRSLPTRSSQSRSRLVKRRWPVWVRSTCGISPIRSYQRRVCAVSPVCSATSLIVYRSWPVGRGCGRCPTHARGLAGAGARSRSCSKSCSITVMPIHPLAVADARSPSTISTLWASSALQASEDLAESWSAIGSGPMESLRMIENWPVPTAAAAVVRADGTVAGSYGPVGHRFPLASVTKPLAAYAALVAVEEGAVELDEAAGPEGATVRHLLAHTSGLAFDEHRAVAAPGNRR